MTQNVIYKYSIRPGGSIYTFPVGYRVLSVGVQAENICAWVEHTTE